MFLSLFPPGSCWGVVMQGSVGGPRGGSRRDPSPLFMGGPQNFKKRGKRHMCAHECGAFFVTVTRTTPFLKSCNRPCDPTLRVTLEVASEVEFGHVCAHVGWRQGSC